MNLLWVEKEFMSRARIASVENLVRFISPVMLSEVENNIACQIPDLKYDHGVNSSVRS